MTKNVDHHNGQITDLTSNVEKLLKEMDLVDTRVMNAVSSGLPWNLLSAVMRFFHDRNDKDRELISTSTEDPAIAG